MKINNIKDVAIYTDGACLGNPGPGGYGVILKYNKNRKELSGGYRITTNNRMELMAAINGLAALKSKCNVKLYSDSKYLTDAISEGWAKNWKANGWMRNKKKVALNSDLWHELLKLCEKHKVEFVWIRGHAGNIENERCDKLAINAAKGSDLNMDENFERNEQLSMFDLN